MRLLLLLCLLVASPAWAVTYWFDSTPWTTYGEFHAVPLFTGSVSGHTATQIQNSQSIRFASSTATIRIYSFISTAAGRQYMVFQDGVAISTVDLPTTPSSTMALVTLATNLNTSSFHEYEIACVSPVQGSYGSWYDAYIELDNLASAVHTNRFVWGWYGDSITGITSSHMTDIGSAAITNVIYADSWSVTHSIGAAMIISGVAGGKVNTTGRDSTGNIPTNVDGVAVGYGVNDLGDLPAGTNAFKAAYWTMLTNIVARIGSGKPILCFQPWPLAWDSDRALATVAGRCIQEVIAAIGNLNIHYVSTDGYYPITTAVLPDGTHPNAYGYTVKAASELAVFQTYTPTNGTTVTTNPPPVSAGTPGASPPGAPAMILFGL